MPRTTFVHGHFNPTSTILYRFDNDDAPRTSFARGTTAAYAAAARTGSVRPPRTRHVPPQQSQMTVTRLYPDVGWQQRGSSGSEDVQQRPRRCSEDAQKMFRGWTKGEKKKKIRHTAGCMTSGSRSSWNKSKTSTNNIARKVVQAVVKRCLVTL